jgi:beta-lactamase regulating signal transducer with metallopeptidase domain
MTDAVAWALVHFVWQGALLGVASWLLQRLVRSPQARYITGVITLAAMPVVFAWTAARQMPVRVAAVTTVTEIEGRFESAHLYMAPIDAAAGSASGLPSEWIVVLWALGIVAFTTRTAGGWMLARRLARVDVTPVAPWVLEQARELTSSLGIIRSVRVLVSARVPAPVLIGWIAPVILLPATAMTGLSSAQVAAVLAHELSHVRRHDYLVNLLQTMVEAVFFFHPAVWLISRRVREDRELCCDDLALGLTDRVTYATALHTLAQRRPAALALGATGGSLVDRIRRITSVGATPTSPKGGWIAMLPVLVVLSLAIPSASSEPVLPTVTNPAAVSATSAEVTVVAPSLTFVDESQARTEPEQNRDSARRTLAERQRELERAAILQGADEALALDALQVREKQLALERLKVLAERQLATGTSVEAAELALLSAEATLAAREKQRALELEHRTLAAEVAVAEKRAELEQRSKWLGPGHPDMKALVAELTDLEANVPKVAVLDSDELVLPGDMLDVRIIGEPQLAPVTVRSDATIRLPFMPAISVRNLTAPQVSAAVAQQLTQRGLASAPSVTVTATRKK